MFIQKAFAVPDKDYFGGRDSASPVHKPNSYRLAVQPNQKQNNNSPKITEIFSGILGKPTSKESINQKKWITDMCWHFLFDKNYDINKY